MTGADAEIFGEALRIEDFFLGRSRATGIFQDLFGKLRLRFVVDIEGSWEDGEFILAEKFVYDDGRRETRTWRIRVIDQTTYEGRADDIVGTAHGKVVGSAVRWTYLLELEIGGARRPMRFHDTFFRVGDVVMNRARMSKFGITLGEATIAFDRS